MKKAIKILTLLIIFVLLIFVLWFTIKPNVKPKSETFHKVNPIQNYKDENAYINGTLENFIQIYCNLVNNRDVDTSFLEDVVDKNSAILQNLKNSITTLRESNKSIDMSILKTTLISDSQDSIALEVILAKTIANQDGSSKKDESTIIITLSKNNGYKITNYSLK